MNEQVWLNISDQRYRCGYHLMAPSGRLTVPSGSIYFKNFFHVFFLYNSPQVTSTIPNVWGHARSRDLIHWQLLKPALQPDSITDQAGCLAGSALIKDGVLYILYLGLQAQSDFQILPSQNLAYSKDGLNFNKYLQNPVINMLPVSHFTETKAAKIWEHDGQYYLLMISQDNGQDEQVVLYTSYSLTYWNYLGPILEQPLLQPCNFLEFFHINGHDIVLVTMTQRQVSTSNFDPQGIYYLAGDLDYDRPYFSGQVWQRLDYGHDLFASQIFQAPDGRLVTIAALGGEDFDQLQENDKGWEGVLSLPRELIWEHNHLVMRPVRECQTLRERLLQQQLYQIHTPKILCDSVTYLEMNLYFFLAQWPGQIFQLIFTDRVTKNQLVFEYLHAQQSVSVRRSDRPHSNSTKIATDKFLRLQIFIDQSTVEIFVNDGQVVFSERFYFQGNPQISLTSDQTLQVDCQLYQLSGQSLTFGD